VPPAEALPPLDDPAARAAAPPVPTERAPREAPQRAVPLPEAEAQLVGPAVGEAGSIAAVILRDRERNWMRPTDAAAPPPPPPPPPPDAAAIATKTTGRDLCGEVVVCPSPTCHTELALRAPTGISHVCCSACSARFFVPVPPPKKKRTGGRATASHHAPPRNPRQVGRAPTTYNIFMQSEERRLLAEAKAAGHSMTSIEAFRVAAVNWRARGQPTAGGGQ
jgi:hypothetical protein